MQPGNWEGQSSEAAKIMIFIISLYIDQVIEVINASF